MRDRARCPRTTWKTPPRACFSGRPESGRRAWCGSAPSGSPCRGRAGRDCACANRRRPHPDNRGRRRWSCCRLAELVEGHLADNAERVLHLVVGADFERRLAALEVDHELHAVFAKHLERFVAVARELVALAGERERVTADDVL